MKQAASIKIVTNQADERYEFMTGGTVMFDNNNTVFIEYQDDIYPVTIGISADTVTITSLGKNPYTLVTKQGEAQPVVLGGMTFSVYTSKLRQKISDGRIDVLVEYSLSDARSETLNTRYRIVCTY